MLCYYFSLDYNNNQATILTIKICKCMHNQCHVHNTILAEHKTMVEPRSKDSSQKLFSGPRLIISKNKKTWPREIINMMYQLTVYPYNVVDFDNLN